MHLIAGAAPVAYGGISRCPGCGDDPGCGRLNDDLELQRCALYISISRKVKHLPKVNIVSNQDTMAPLPATIVKSETYSDCISRLSSFISSLFYDDPHADSMQYPQASKFSQTLGTDIDLPASEHVGLLRARFEPAFSVVCKRGVSSGMVGIIIGIVIVVIAALLLGSWVAKKHN